MKKRRRIRKALSLPKGWSVRFNPTNSPGNKWDVLKDGAWIGTARTRAAAVSAARDTHNCDGDVCV